MYFVLEIDYEKLGFVKDELVLVMLVLLGAEPLVISLVLTE